MNLLHMKYAVEVARLGSLNKAAEVLMVAQPNISRSIKELEGDLGITIFRRSAKGMTLTPDGEEFMERAREVLGRIEQIEQTYSDPARKKRRFGAVLPRECDLSPSLSAFSQEAIEEGTELFWEHGDAKQAMQRLGDGECKLAVVAYPLCYEPHYQSAIEEKGLVSETVAQLPLVLLMSAAHDLAAEPAVEPSALSAYKEIALPPPYVPSLSPTKVMRELYPDTGAPRVFVNDRAVRLELLAADPNAFAWSLPTSAQTLARYGLVERACTVAQLWRIALLCPRGYKQTALDKSFIAALLKNNKNPLACTG